ncbi:VOC family protein [Ilumatobacter nonamiensis]|uniref:VOC family protein n=1 Tax=Ilumatobacter nonamiensis TaxID=467093 RepID=UPI00034D6DBF|nr:VOC family protein [Ilumatobacter nonamiensis]
MTTITTVSTVAIPTSNQDRSVTFYVDRLGFEKRVDVEMSAGFRWIEVAPPGSDVTVTLLQAGDEMPAGRDTGIRLVATDAAAEHEAMTEAGVDVGELLDWPDAPLMFAFRDVDDNTLYLVETE